ncbi:MAG: patatin-like phospholipase family protein [Chloroflexota bacterium]
MQHPPNPVSGDGKQFVDLVCEGGGVRGIALVGALAVLEERGYVPQNLAGTSAGAIVATLRAAGYDPSAIYDIMTSKDFDFQRIQDTAWEDRLPGVGTPLSMLLDLGLYEGEYFLGLMRELLAQKNVYRFSDLIHPDFADVDRFRYKVRVIASDITAGCLLALPQDAKDNLGTPADELDVALAVRMSMSIPAFFEPVTYQHRETGCDHLIVDGGILSNFPVWLFDVEGEPAWPTFGLRLVEDDVQQPLARGLEAPLLDPGRVSLVVDYVKRLIETMMQAHDRLYLEQDSFVRTIPIDTLGIAATSFKITRTQVDDLYQSGRQAAEAFLATWDFDAYKAEFRSGKHHSRRTEVTALLADARKRIGGKGGPTHDGRGE